MPIISSPGRHNFFVRCWTGRAPLWQAFWFCGVAGAVVLLVGLLPAISASPIGAASARLLFGSAVLGYASFASVSIWRCAGKADVSPLGALAKVYAAMSLLLWVMLLVVALTFQE